MIDASHPLISVFRMVLICLMATMFFRPVRADWEWTESSGWSRSDEAARSTAPAQLVYAQSFERKGEFYDAARQYFLLVRTYPESAEAANAMTRLAVVLFELENFYFSFKAIEDLLVKYPQTGEELKQQLMEMEYSIGEKFLGGAPRSLFEDKNREEDRYAAAVEVFNAIISHDPYGPQTDRAYYSMGRAYNEMSQPEKAKQSLYKMIADFPESRLIPLARYQISLSNMQMGAASGTEARRQLDRVKADLEADDGSPKVDKQLSEVNQSLNRLEELEAERMLKNAQFYQRMKTHKGVSSAVFTYKEILRRYPNTKAAVEAAQSLEGVTIPSESTFSLPKLSLPTWPFGKKEDTPAAATPTVQAAPQPTLPADPNAVPASNLGAMPLGIPGSVPQPDISSAGSDPFASPSSPVLPDTDATGEGMILNATPHVIDAHANAVEVMTHQEPSALESIPLPTSMDAGVSDVEREGEALLYVPGVAASPSSHVVPTDGHQNEIREKSPATPVTESVSEAWQDLSRTPVAGPSESGAPSTVPSVPEEVVETVTDGATEAPAVLPDNTAISLPDSVEADTGASPLSPMPMFRPGKKVESAPSPDVAPKTSAPHDADVSDKRNQIIINLDDEPDSRDAAQGLIPLP